MLSTENPSESKRDFCRRKAPNLAAEVNKLFALYRFYVGDRQPMAGGAQSLALKVQRGEMDDQNVSFKLKPFKVKCQSSMLLLTTFEDLPIWVKLHVFSYLDPQDLCNACSVNSSWRAIASDEYIWKSLLLRDSFKWRQIYYDKMPDVYKRVCPLLSSMQIYMKCRERTTPSTSDSQFKLSTIFHQLMSSGKSRIVMFGPGLETKTSKLVRSILTDRCLNEAARFKVTGLVPGSFSGVGSGISIRFDDRSFNLVVLYSNVKSIRQRLSAETRTQQNKLFVHEERGAQDDSDVVTHYYELTPTIQELCKHSQAFIYVVDATQPAREIGLTQAELFAMTCELWAPVQAPVLVLACRRNCSADLALPSIEVARALRLGRLNRKWMVQSAEVESLDGVRSGLRWLLSEM